MQSNEIKAIGESVRAKPIRTRLSTRQSQDMDESHRRSLHLITKNSRKDILGTSKLEPNNDDSKMLKKTRAADKKRPAEVNQ